MCTAPESILSLNLSNDGDNPIKKTGADNIQNSDLKQDRKEYIQSFGNCC